MSTPERISQLARELDETLSGSIGEIRDLNERTHVLAINARIEAAHAGDSGRSFGVLAQEVRKLSAMSGDTGKRMSEKVGVISAAIAAAHRSAEESARREAASMVASEAAIHGVMGNFRGVTEVLEASADVLKRESIGIQSEIVEALVQLQFQDRVSQRMTHVRHNIERLPALMADSRGQFDRSGLLAPVDAQALLAELEGSYAMADERATHRSGQAPGPATATATTTAPASGSHGPATAAPAAVEEVTFF